jgi:hypothetical protein
MPKLSIDPSLQLSLEQLGGAVQLIGKDGDVIGYFVPVPSQPRKLPPGVQISDEELDRRRREGGCVTTEELINRLY